LIKITENLIEITRNTTEIIDLTCLDEDGIPYDLTGFEVTFYVMDDPGKPPTQAVITKKNDLAGGSSLEITVIDAANGVIRVFLLPDDTKDLNGNIFAYSVFIKLANVQEYPFLNAPMIVVDDIIYEYEGWSIHKGHIAYYAFGNQDLFAQVPDFICENAVTNMCNKLTEFITTGCTSVDKSDKTLNLAIEYYAVCELKSSGNVSEGAGDITRESIGDKSISYANEMRSNVDKVSMPHNSCDKASWLVEQYAKTKGLAGGTIVTSIKNYRSKIFSDTYNKYTCNNRYGVPE
jgi:hypothetical protein